jgi:hypothetical protein
MNEPTIRVPVNCPECAQEHLFDLATATAAAALLRNDCLKLQCPCQMLWVATDIERVQIREYLAAFGSASKAGFGVE